MKKQEFLRLINYFNDIYQQDMEDRVEQGICFSSNDLVDCIMHYIDDYDDNMELKDENNNSI